MHVKRLNKIVLLLLILLLKSNFSVYAEEDNTILWTAGAIKSEANSQPLIAQCYIGFIVIREAELRGISVEELVKETNFLSGWKYSDWHRNAYLYPDDKYKDIAKLSLSGYCYTDARWFNAKSTVIKYRRITDMDESFHKFSTLDRYTSVECLQHPSWSTVVRLVAEEGQLCFYGY